MSRRVNMRHRIQSERGRRLRWPLQLSITIRFLIVVPDHPAAGVECSKGTRVIVSSRTFFMTSMSTGRIGGMAVAPDIIVNHCWFRKPVTYFFRGGGYSSQQFEMAHSRRRIVFVTAQQGSPGIIRVANGWPADSGLPPKRDIVRAGCHVPKVPNPEVMVSIGH